MTRILHIDSSADLETSTSRALSQRIVDRFAGAEVTRRDLARAPLPQIDHTWAVARMVPPADRSAEQAEALAESDKLIAEIKAADVIVMGAPVYNFSIPASLKAWIDLVARAGETFKYTEQGPVGLVEDKRVIVAIASGGTEIGSDIDFHSGYLRFALGFMGMTDITMIAADRIFADRDAALEKAHGQIDALTV